MTCPPPTAPLPTPSSLQLAAGHTLAVLESGALLEITHAGGVKLCIRLTESGPVLEMDTPSLTIRNRGALALEGESICLKSRGVMSLESGGGFSQRVGGDCRIAVRDDMEIRAQAVGMEAETGGMALKANDDLDLKGLRILHNVPDQEEAAARLNKAATFGETMKCPAVDHGGPRPLGKGKPLPREDW